MPRIVQYECDGCGKIKGSDNHWFSVSGDANSFQVSRFDRNATSVFCGEQCVLTALSDWLASAKMHAAGPEKLAVVNQ